MTPEERAEMRRHEKALADEVISWKLSASARRNAMTEEERVTHDKQIADDYNARIAKVRAMSDEERCAYFEQRAEKHRAQGFYVA
jgi:hypothetical protein